MSSTLPYGDELVTGDAVALTVRPAGFGLRVLSGLIDWICWLLLYVLLLVLLGAFGGVLDVAALAAFSIAAIVVSFIIVPVLFETFSRGRSPGRFALGLRIVRDDGGGIQFRHALVRGVMALPEIVFTLGGLAALVALFSPKAKRIGDWLAGTYSQNERLPPLTRTWITMPTSLESWAAVADVGRLPDGLARRIAAFLHQTAAMAPQSRERMAALLAAEAAPYVSPWPQAPNDYALAAIAATRRERELRARELSAERRRALGPTLHQLPAGFPER